MVAWPVAVLREMTLDYKKHHLGDMPCLAKNNEGPMPVGKSYLHCVSRRAFVRLQCLSTGACLQCLSTEASDRLQFLSKTTSYNAYPESVSHTMLVERSILTMRIERSICPLSMLVERSMLTMRIERSISPLTMLVERSMVHRRHWFFWSDGFARSITECICLYQDDSLEFILQTQGREGDYAPS